mmetsp:Transcript_8027/g.10781  ORF Transcript_8027/g.10781 Transcript_8027/m.10781 type:complete len:418 (-) Transcript_8027:544-1797(-)
MLRLLRSLPLLFLVSETSFAFQFIASSPSAKAVQKLSHAPSKRTNFLQMSPLTPEPSESVKDEFGVDKSNRNNVKKNAFFESCKSFLDLNKDGKIDAEDMKVLVSRLEKCFDINGDGKVDAKDAKAALSIVTLSSALFISPSPAQAKGGHGGGHSSSHSHHSSSRRRRSSGGYDSRYSDEEEHLPKYKRPNRQGSVSLDPRMCFDLPEDREIVEVLYENEFSGAYVQASVVDVQESKCKFTVQPLDNSATRTLSTDRNHNVYEARALAFLAVVLFDEDIMSKLKDDRFDLEFYKLSPPTPNTPRPDSGNFDGISSEWNNESKVSQEVRVTLRFEDDGIISGSGIDSIDGSYVLSGNWKDRNDGYLLRWKETYDDFDVEVKCEMTNVDDKVVINGTYKSSLGVRGNFKLDRKKKKLRF